MAATDSGAASTFSATVADQQQSDLGSQAVDLAADTNSTTGSGSTNTGSTAGEQVPAELAYTGSSLRLPLVGLSLLLAGGAMVLLARRQEEAAGLVLR